MKASEKILTLAREVPFFSTPQAARYFLKNGSPLKRASETLKKLEAAGWIEGRRREIGKSKIWRLTSEGRKRLGVEKVALPFNSPKIEHVLGIGGIFQELFDSGRLAYFAYEPKDEFYIGRKMFYAPDAFFILKGNASKGVACGAREVQNNSPSLSLKGTPPATEYAAYLLEYQRSPLSSNRWAAKWAVASLFFDNGHYMEASWQVLKGKILKPGIIAITDQPEEIVKNGILLNLTISKEIHSIL